MKKLLLMALGWYLSIVSVFYAQDFETGFSKPVASVSSLANYTNSPVSYATGIPDISFPLASLPTNATVVSAGVSLSYHPKNLMSNEKASDVGLGWSLLGSNGVISREIIKGLDEKYRDASGNGYFKNEFDDIYYYNIGGYNGKFRILRNTQDNTFQLIKLTPSNLKIEYVRNANNATLIFDSFKITDDKGFIYLFDTYAVSEYKEGNYGIEYRSAFFLTKIYDYRMQELVAFDYQVDTYTSPSAPLRTFRNCKLKKIRSKDNGSVEFNYSYEASLRKSMNDPYQVNSILVKNNAGNLLSKTEFLYGYISFTNPVTYGEYITKRTLAKIIKYGSDPGKSETTEFDYNNSGSDTDYGAVPGRYKDYFLCTSNSNEIENPQYFPVGSLKTVKLPTGGKIEYSFEANEYGFDKSQPNYAADLGLEGFTDPQVQYLKEIYSGDFNTHVSKTYSFTVSGSTSSAKSVYVRFMIDEIEPYNPMLNPGDGSSPTLYYTIPGANYNDGITGILCAAEDGSISSSRFQLAGGTHTLKVETQTAGKGHFEIYETAVIPGPYRNAMVRAGLGIRIRDIKYFDKLSTQTPVKTETFRYDTFADANTSSGEAMEQGGVPGEPEESVIYKNVKVLNGDNGGYTRYYFKTPSSYPLQASPPGYGYWPNINITRSGLLEKKEVYDTSNKMLASENYDYTISEMNVPKYIPFENGYYETRTAYVKEQRIASKVFDKNGRSVTTNSETVRSADDFNLVKESVTNSDGSTNEKNYQYAREKNNTALLAANILSAPLQTQVKKNGTVVSGNELRYDNSSQLYPTSILVYTPDNMANSYTGIRYDVYDEKGHVVQYSLSPDAAGNGAPATVIWGYNKTVPIAKIEGAKLSDIPQNLIDAIVTASDEDAAAAAGNAQAREDALLAQLETFKNHSSLSGFSITAYTYDPMIGVTNVLPPDGIREKYVYDSFGRLQKVIDTNGRTLKEYQYNYKQ